MKSVSMECIDFSQLSGAEADGSGDEVSHSCLTILPTVTERSGHSNNQVAKQETIESRS